MEAEDAFDKLMAIHHNEDVNQESEDESDQGTPEDGDPITTFRMLLENCSLRDTEFIDRCQHALLLPQNSSCPQCSSAMLLVEGPQSLDGLEWQCLNCSSQLSVRHGSWFADINQSRLKEILLILYWWSRKYDEKHCQHELESANRHTVSLVYKKCQQLLTDYFRHEVSSIGAAGYVVDIDIRKSSNENKYLLVGVERRNLKQFFVFNLPMDLTRDDIMTAIINNVHVGSILAIQRKSLLEALDKDGLDYLKNTWHYKVNSDPYSAKLDSVWYALEKAFDDRILSNKSISEYIFRQRMESAKDPFLFLLSTIKVLYPLSSKEDD